MNTGANMANIRARYRLGNLSLTVALVLAASLPAAARQKGKFTATPVSQGATYAVGVTTGGGTAGARVQAQAQTRAVKRVSVIVKLADPSLAAYKGGINGLAATSPAVTGAAALNVSAPESKKYLSYLADKQNAFAASARTISGAEVRQRFDVVFGGVSMVLPETQLAALRALPGVKAVYMDQLLQPDTNVSPQFIGAPHIWNE